MIKVKVSNSLVNKLRQAFSDAHRKKVDTLVTALKEATPVDTGEARNGWHVEGNSIVNNVEHIGMLNEGSSSQAPAHFVERTLLSQKGVTASGTIVRST